MKSGYELSMEIRSLREAIEELKCSIESLSCLEMKERIQGGDISPDKSLINKLSRLNELQEKLKELVEDQLSLAEEIEKIEDWKARVVARYRKINNFTWEQISEKTGFHESYCRKLYKKSMRYF